MSPLPAYGGGVTGEQLKTLADANIIGVIVATPGGIVEANDAFLAIIGCTRADFEGSIDWRAITPPEYAERDRLAADELQVRGACTPFETEFWRKDGSRVAVQIGAALLDRDPMRWIAFVQDVSARKLVEHELREAAVASETTTQAIDDFVNMLVHELRQPIAAIATAAGIVKDRVERNPLGPALARPLAALSAQIGQLMRLTDELLLGARIVRGAMPILRADVDLVELVREVVGDSKTRAEAGELTLVFEPPPGTVIVKGDHLRLRHVALNLLGNAIKYTRPGGGIAVSLIAGDSICELRVRDTGIGIAAAELPHVFKPYHRGTREGSGFGLGLAIVRSVVEQHGGSVRISSEGLNQGTEVVVTLPVVPASV